MVTQIIIKNTIYTVVSIVLIYLKLGAKLRMKVYNRLSKAKVRPYKYKVIFIYPPNSLPTWLMQFST